MGISPGRGPGPTRGETVTPSSSRSERRAGSGWAMKIHPSKGIPPVRVVRSLKTAPGQNTLMMAVR